MFGHSGLELLPSTPWQAAHVKALALPASAEPSTKLSARSGVAASMSPVSTNSDAILIFIFGIRHFPAVAAAIA
jgi:hypothetical protein